MVKWLKQLQEVANGCERLWTVWDQKATWSKHTSTPMTAERNKNPWPWEKMNTWTQCQHQAIPRPEWFHGTCLNLQVEWSFHGLSRSSGCSSSNSCNLAPGNSQHTYALNTWYGHAAGFFHCYIPRTPFELSVQPGCPHFIDINWFWGGWGARVYRIGGPSKFRGEQDL